MLSKESKKEEMETNTGSTKSTRSTRTRKTRKSKDPNAPKRALSAYMYFANENRDIVRSENPEISFGQMGKLLGERWKSLNDQDKLPYENKAKIDKERYYNEKELYNNTMSKI